MDNKIINFNEPYLTGNELKYIKDVFSRGRFYGNGYYTDKCQNLIAQRTLARQVLLTDSCTSAIEISALLLRNWEIEQEVIMPSYTFSSTAAAFAKFGFKVVFAEINPKTFMLDLQDVKKKINPKTSVIVIVHYGGSGLNLKPYEELCHENSIYLVEDAAQAFGCKDGNYFLGTIGDLGCFSFHETKNIQAGMSGALLVNNIKFKDRAIHILERGTNRNEVLKGLVDKYSWVEIGGSYSPSELQAAFLLAQLENFDSNIVERKSIFFGYLKIFSKYSLDKLSYISFEKDYSSNFHAFWVLFASSKECDFIRQALIEKKINAFIGYVPLHSSKVGASMGYVKEDLRITEEYSKRILRLPLHNNMTSNDSSIIAEIIIKLLKEYRK